MADRQLTPTEAAVYDAYLRTMTKTQDWVRLSDLRPLVQADRDATDTALRSLVRHEDAVLAPDSSRARNRPDQAEAAILVSGEANHLITFHED